MRVEKSSTYEMSANRMHFERVTTNSSHLLLVVAATKREITGTVVYRYSCNYRPMQLHSANKSPVSWATMYARLVSSNVSAVSEKNKCTAK